MEYSKQLESVDKIHWNKYHTYYADDEKINLENFAEEQN